MPMTDHMLWLCLSEAEGRKNDKSLPIDARIRSSETYAICLRAAADRGLTYDQLRGRAVLTEASHT